ncbi:MAG: SigB/SigF/SigG family RNA polymerase sigma factor [Acidimicrobiales bacterium]
MAERALHTERKSDSTTGGNDQADVRERFRAYRRSADRDLRNQLIDEHRWVATHCAGRFAHRGEPMNDLMQVALLGVLKAVERYDPSYDVRFATFAVPTVLGELRRHFRDATWSVRVPRRAKELHLELGAATEELSQALGRSPKIGEVAERMGVTEEDVLMAMEANSAYRTAPLIPGGDHDDDAAEEGAILGVEDLDLSRVDTRLTVRRMLLDLPERERRILVMRFFEGRTQAEIGEEIGLSQVHVSRLLRRSLDRLHDRLGSEAEVVVGAGNR